MNNYLFLIINHINIYYTLKFKLNKNKFQNNLNQFSQCNLLKYPSPSSFSDSFLSSSL